jgi:hypothetical protein
MSERDPEKAADFIIKSAKPYAQAKANRMYLEEYRKTKKALLMNASDGKTVSDRESYAYAHPEYEEVLNKFKDAILEEEALRVLIKGAELTIEIWRSKNASNRNQDRAMR